MPNEGNEMMKRFLQRVVNDLLKKKDFSEISKVDVFFAFGSKHKSAMCDYVYGMKIQSDIPTSMKNTIVSDLTQKIRRTVEKNMNKSVCCTDTIWVKTVE